MRVEKFAVCSLRFAGKKSDGALPAANCKLTILLWIS
jgi:hypothetical protein